VTFRASRGRIPRAAATPQGRRAPARRTIDDVGNLAALFQQSEKREERRERDRDHAGPDPQHLVGGYAFVPVPNVAARRDRVVGTRRRIPDVDVGAQRLGHAIRHTGRRLRPVVKPRHRRLARGLGWRDGHEIAAPGDRQGPASSRKGDEMLRLPVPHLALLRHEKPRALAIDARGMRVHRVGRPRRDRQSDVFETGAALALFPVG